MLFPAAAASLALGAPAAANGTVGVLLTHWATPRGWNFQYAWSMYTRSMRGARQHFKNELPCTREFVGTPPYSYQVGLVPFALLGPVSPLESVYDGNAVYRHDKERGLYIPMAGTEADLPPVPEAAMANKTLVQPHLTSLSTAANPLGPDPRDGTLWVDDYVVIREPDGVSDLHQGTALEMLRNFRMSGAPLTSPEMDQQDPSAIGIQDRTGELVAADFPGLVTVLQGGYAEVTDPTGQHPENTFPTVEDSAVKMARSGVRRMLIARETTDNNNYADNVQSAGFTKRGLCMHGYGDMVATKQVKQVGRTPEYNTALLRTLGRHLRQPWVQKDQPIAVIYLTRGQPWGVSEAEMPDGTVATAFGSPMKHCQEVYPENVLLNFLTFKRAALAAYGSEYQLVFERAAARGSDLRMDNHLVYGTTTNASASAGGTNGVFKTWRTALNDVKADGVAQGITVLSHWDYSWYESYQKIREVNDVPLSPTPLLQARVFNHSWCEGAGGAAPCGSPNATARFSVTECFDNDESVDAFATGYAHVIRGGVERFGVLPPALSLRVEASAAVSRHAGGAVVARGGPLAGAALRVPADPHPTWPESFTPANASLHNDPADTMDALWPDLDGETFSLASVGNATAFPAPPGAASPVVYAMPYRTMFNRPVNITISAAGGCGAADAPRPHVWNHVTGAWQPVPIPPGLPAGGAGMWCDTTSGAITFPTDVLGAFILARQAQ